MKTSIQIIATALVILFGNAAFGQSDTMYVMKNGVVINKQSVNSSDLDSLTFYHSKTTPTITDADGNVYTSVTIGTQEWMTENLRTTKYSDGTAIPNVTDNDEWKNLSTGAWCHYDNDSTQYEATYGKLYNWYAASDSRNVCPTGWHLPTDGEWTVLTDYLAEDGHSGTEGIALKAKSGWDDSYGQSGNGTDDYGFSGLPGGYRYSDGFFISIGTSVSWWSSSKVTNWAWNRLLIYVDDSLSRQVNNNRRGFSIRCLRD